MFNHYLNSVLDLEAGIGSDRTSAFHNAIFNMRIVPYIHIIQNNTVLDVAVIANICFLEYNRIFNRSVNDTSTGYKTVLNNRTCIVFCILLEQWIGLRKKRRHAI